MANLTRKYKKIFAGNAGIDIDSGNVVFGSNAAGSPVSSNDPVALENLSAFETGFSAATIAGTKLPVVGEVQALKYDTDYHLAYIYQNGMQVYNSQTDYYIDNLVREDNTGKIWKSLINNNIGNALVEGANWTLVGDLSSLKSATTSTSGTTLLPQPITIANNGTDADHDLDFSAGNAQADDGSLVFSVAALTKKADESWVAGNNQGGMELPVTLTGTYTTSGTTVTGVGSAFLTEFAVGDILGSSAKNEARRILSIASDTSMTLHSAFTTNVTVAESVKRGGWLAPNTPFYCYAIYKDSSTKDILYACKKGSPNLPATYTKKSYIGACHTDINANLWSGTYSYGKGFYNFSYNTHLTDLNTVIGNTGVLRTISAPGGSKARFTFGASATGSGAGVIRAYDGTASGSGQTDLHRATGYFSVNVTAASGYVEAYVDYASRIKTDVVVTSGSPTLTGVISTQGWTEYL